MRSASIHAFVLITLTVTSLASATFQPAGHRQAQAEWWRRAPAEQFGRYWIKSDLPASRTRALAQQINAMHRHFARRLANLSIRQPDVFNVLAFQSRDAFVQTMRTRFGKNVQHLNGVFFTHPDFDGLALHTEQISYRRIEIVVQREAFRQFAYSRFGGDLPMWLNEGLAHLFGQSIRIDDQLIVGQPTPNVISALRSAIEDNAYLPFDQFIPLDDEQWRRAETEAHGQLMSAQAWSMAHFLLFGADGRYRDAAQQYFRLLNNALPADVAFQRAFGVHDNWSHFESAWRAYVNDLEPGAFATAMQRLEFLAAGMHALSQRDVYPDSLDALKTSLREIEFTHTLQSLGGALTLRADDDSVFAIPSQTQSRRAPVFVIQKANPRINSRRDRQREIDKPTPPTIATKHLQPKDLIVQWMRDPDTNTFTYRIDVK